MMKKILACCFACLSTLSTPLSANESSSSIKSSPQQINKSERDERDERLYQITELKNGMRVLLVSDPKASKSLGAVALPIGSLADPKSQQGLAHYTEHMVLMGSQKYPEPSSFSQFLNQHAGSYNASTGQTRTAYFFEVEHAAFNEATDRLADALGQPKLDEVNADKERNAVNAELTLARSNEGFRLAQVDSETLNQAHPASYFSGGNLETLSDKPDSKLHDELIKFYQTYYSAQIMVGILYSNQSIEELSKLADTTFGSMPSHPVTLPEIQVEALPKETLSQTLYIEPAQAKKLLHIQYPIENNLLDFNEKSDEYIAYLLNSRSENTLFDQLQKQGLIESISAYPYPNRYGNSGQFSIYLSLTDKGLEQTETILAALQAYLKLIKSDGISEDYYQEIQKILNLSFNYPDINRDMRYVEWLADQMLLYPSQHILDADYIATHFNPQKIEQRLNQLTLDNARVWLIAPGQKTDKVAYFIGTPYRTEPISDSDKKAIESLSTQFQFELPKLNPYVVDDFQLIESVESNTNATQVFSEKGNNLYLKTHYFTNEPKAVITLSLRSDLALNSAENQVKYSLIEYLIQRKTAQLRYQASVAGVDISFRRDNGISIQISGFNQHMDKILLDLLREYQHFNVTDAELALAKSNFLERLTASDQANSYSLAMEQVTALSFIPYFSKEERRQITESITKESLESYAAQLLPSSAPYMLSIGNISQEQANKLYHTLIDTLAVTGEYHPSQSLRIRESETAIFTQKAASTDNALYSVYLPISENKIDDQMKSYLLYKIISPWFYDKLRTQEQLGYVVSALPSRVGDGFGLGFLIQSNNSSPRDLLTHYEHFFEETSKQLASLSEDEFSQYKQGILSELDEAPQTLDDEMNSYMSDFIHNQFAFTSKEDKKEALAKLTKEAMLSFYDRSIKQREGLILQSQVLGQELNEEGAIKGENNYPNASQLQQKLLQH